MFTRQKLLAVAILLLATIMLLQLVSGNVIQASNQGGTIRVPEDYDRISLAIRVAKDGDVIIIGPGVYEERISVEKSITLKSTDPLNPAVVEKTVLAGGLEFSSRNIALMGFTIYSEKGLGGWPEWRPPYGGTETISFKSVVIIYGGSVTLKNNKFINPKEYDDMGAIGYIPNQEQAEIMIDGNTITGFSNEAICIYGYPSHTATDSKLLGQKVKMELHENHKVTIKNNIITDNWVGICIGLVAARIESNTIYNNEGGGIWGELSTVTIRNNTIENNGYGIKLRGGTYPDGFTSIVNVSITDNKIIGNKGSGIVLYDGVSGAITNNTIAKNKNNGIYLWYWSGAITNNIIVENKAEPWIIQNGGGIYLSSSRSIIADNVFKKNQAYGEENQAYGKGGAIYVDRGSEILDKKGQIILPPRRDEKELNNIYGTGDEANIPDDVYFE